MRNIFYLCRVELRMRILGCFESNIYKTRKKRNMPKQLIICVLLDIMGGVKLRLFYPLAFTRESAVDKDVKN